MSKVDKLNIEYAIQQFTGYQLAQGGGSVVELAESMGLTQDEWEYIKLNYGWILAVSVAELDHYFEQEDKQCMNKYTKPLNMHSEKFYKEYHEKARKELEND